ncbi:MAG: mannose-1-phosphate guanylyltransferase [Paludibacteraceae bacterium]|nr:mannose-1-phosphate guanylyltransferase [Paludibacteraceae bacterium]
MKNNYCVIMAGGIGSRFWPASRNNRPKQFLDFFGTGHSLLQMTVDRFRPLVPIENVLIVTNVLYKDLILEQIPDLKPEQVLCEPARRNTAPCIAYAIAHIKGMVRQRTGLGEEVSWDDDRLNANIVVSPSDHLILHENQFRKTIRTSFAFVEKHDSLLTLGMKPSRPETGYGYIQLSNQTINMVDSDIYKVRAFTEKPNRELAEVFLKSGEFLWNSGIFIWNLRTIRHAFAEFLPEVVDKFMPGEKLMGTAEEEAYIQDKFPSCPNISIDYGILEKSKNVYVLPSDFGWSDLGTWGSLYELSEKDEQGNATLKCHATYYDSHNNMVTLPEGHLAVVKGLDDYIVAEADDVLLICPKGEEQQIREFVTDAEIDYKGRYN